MPNSKRKCKFCGDRILKEDGLIVGLSFFCSIDHATKYGQAKAPKVKEQRERKEKQERKLKLKTAGDYTREAQAAFNKYVRVRDKNEPCISCDWPDDGSRQRHSSHYRPAGKNTDLRFNVFNAHASCSICNNFKSGNLTEYRPRLINKIGLDKVLELETNNELRRFDIEYLERIKKIFSKKARLYERRFR